MKKVDIPNQKDKIRQYIIKNPHLKLNNDEYKTRMLNLLEVKLKVIFQNNRMSNILLCMFQNHILQNPK